MATTVLGLKTFTASDPVDYNEVNDNYTKIDAGVKTALQGRAAHNLLDNSDFTNPVNQRGATTTSQYKYFLDRWISRLSDISLAVGNSGLTLTSSATANIFIYQKLSAGKALNGKTVTVAVCDGTGNVATTTTNLPTTNATSWTSYAVAQTNNGVYASVIDLGSGDYPIAVRVGVQSDALNKTIRWVALYEGSYDASTLPAYQPKGYAAELAECQMFHREDVVVPVFKMKDAIFLIGTVIQMRDMGGLKPTITLKKFTRPGVIDVTSFNASDRIDIENLGGGRYLLMNAILVSCMDYASGHLRFSVNADI